MFNQISQTFIDLNELSLVHLYLSLNEPVISLEAGTQAEPARGYLMVFKNKSKQIEMYAGLFFSSTRRRILYKVDPFQPELLSNRVSVGEGFLSEMGFMMDNTHCARATEQERAELLRQIPFAYQEIELFFQAMSTSEMNFKERKQMAHEREQKHVVGQQSFYDHYLELIGML